MGIVSARWRIVIGLVALLGIGGSLLNPAPHPAAAQTDGEVRALWVDAFHDGIKSPAQVEKLVADARRANINTLLVQVRRSGDVYYLGGPEAPASDQPKDYDALQTLLTAARSGTPRLEVHAWIPAYRIWNSQTRAPADPNHPYNLHGPTAAGENNWLMVRDDGESWTGEGYWLDPGHPAVQQYLVDLATDLVRRYDVDGLHLDRIRYYEGASTGGVRDRRWGYNGTSVMRFDLENGRVGQPDPNDPAWMQFRRDQVTELVRRTRESALAARPGLKLSAAVIPWGNGPDSMAQWERAAAYAYVFQDWRGWLEQGLLDQAYVMNYFRDSSADQASWLDRWLTWQRGNSYGRQVIAGLAIYLNEPADSVRQIRRALAPGADGSRMAGVALYSYAVPDPTLNNPDPSDNRPEGFVWDVLTRSAPENDFNPPFAQPAAVPAMSWRTDQAAR